MKKMLMLYVFKPYFSLLLHETTRFPALFTLKRKVFHYLFVILSQQKPLYTIIFMLKKIRLILAIIFWVFITWLLVDFTGTAHAYLGWMAKIQFVPALLALNVGALLFVVTLTLLMGRIYCSVICPLGVMQDVIAWFRRKKNKYSYSPAKNTLRYSMLVLACAALALNVAWLGGIIFPYSTYGRIVSTCVAPLYKLANNGLAALAEHYGSYAFYEVDVWVKSISALVVALLTWGIIAVLAWRGGRTWCNTICPVGTLLGLISSKSYFKMSIDADKCKNCRKCERNCKAACIDLATHTVDTSRCVVCGNCELQCAHDALHFTSNSQPQSEIPLKVEDSGKKASPRGGSDGTDRRAVLTSVALLAGTALAKALPTSSRRKNQSATSSSHLPARCPSAICAPIVRPASSALMPVPTMCCAQVAVWIASCNQRSATNAATAVLNVPAVRKFVRPRPYVLSQLRSVQPFRWAMLSGRATSASLSRMASPADFVPESALPKQYRWCRCRQACIKTVGVGVTLTIRRFRVKKCCSSPLSTRKNALAAALAKTSVPQAPSAQSTWKDTKCIGRYRPQSPHSRGEIVRHV